MTFGEKLKNARTHMGYKQAELAKKLGTTGNTISNWENNVSKPDLDTLSYICGILHVSASYFLEATLPEDEVSITELNMIKKYRDLDDHGKEMVDFTLRKEWERSVQASKIEEKVIYPFNSSIPTMVAERTYYNGVDAACPRTDIDIPEGVDTSDDDIMDSPDY